jgi:hypothetical protein
VFHPIITELQDKRFGGTAPIVQRLMRKQPLPKKAPPGGFGKAAVLPFPVLHSTAGAFLKPPREKRWGAANVAFCFFETDSVPDKYLAHARAYDLVLAGSHFNTRVLREYGLQHVFTAWQGVDTQLFSRLLPTGKAEAELPKLQPLLEAGGGGAEAFVVFSGGKLELRKGQDVTVAVFRAFLQVRGTLTTL